MNLYYDDGTCVIYHQDCLDVLPFIADEEVDIVVTSPPYNMGLVPGGNGRGMYRPGASNKAGRFRAGYDGKNDDALEYDAYCAWQRLVLEQCYRVARDGVFYNHRTRVEHGRLRLPLDFDFGELWPRQIITWDRGTGIDVNLRAYCTAQEWILLFAKPSFQLVDHSASGMSDVWRLGMRHGSAHPAPFPLSLPARAIATTGATSVLDPFMGSGTTLRAAKDAGIRRHRHREERGVLRDGCRVARTRSARIWGGSGVTSTPAANLHSWWVMTPERCDYYYSPWSYEPPEYGRDVVVVHATCRSAAIRTAWRRPEMADWAQEMRGDGKPPWHLLTAELADCRHGALLSENETSDCPWCLIEDAWSWEAEEEIINDPWVREAL